MSTSSNTKTHIKAAAASLFGKKGFAATSMSDIAKAVGITKASLYHFFKGKEQLYLELVEHMVTEAQLVIDGQPAPGTSAQERLITIVESLLDLATTATNLMRSPETTLMATCPNECLALVEKMRLLEQGMSERVRELGHEHPELGAQILFHAVFGHSKRRQSLHDPDAPTHHVFATYLVSLLLPKSTS